MSKRIKCEECGGKILIKKVPYSIYEIKVGDYTAEQCQKCGEICFSEEESKKITQKTKQMNLWGLESKTKIGKVGDALDVRISKKLESFLKLKKGEEVFVRPQGKYKILIELVT